MADLAARTDVGLVRERNEDRWLARDYAGVTLLAVADGVGGEAGGEIASDAAIDALAKSFAPPSFRESARSALGAAVQHANQAVLDAAAHDERYPRAASTLVATAIRGREAAVANLGDSRAYLVRGGDIRQLTTDHSGETLSSITRFVGDPRGVQPDIFVETLVPGDRIELRDPHLALRGCCHAGSTGEARSECSQARSSRSISPSRSGSATRSLS